MEEIEIFFIGMERKWERESEREREMERERERCSETKLGRKEFQKKSMLENENINK
jgi:hypothetical protein